MHFHLVNVQVINRQAFQVKNFKGVPASFTAPATPPNANETGWKETVMMFPGTVTRVIMRFDLPAVPLAVLPLAGPGQPPDRRQRVCLALPHPGARRARYDASAYRDVEQQMMSRDNPRISHLRGSVFAKFVDVCPKASRCPLLAQSGRGRVPAQCPLLGVKRT